MKLRPLIFIASLLALTGVSTQYVKADENSMKRAAQSLSFSKQLNTLQFPGLTLYDNSANPNNMGFRGYSAVADSTLPDTLISAAKNDNIMFFYKTNNNGTGVHIPQYGDVLVPSSQSDSTAYLRFVRDGSIDSTFINVAPYVQSQINDRQVQLNAGKTFISRVSPVFGDKNAGQTLSDSVSVSGNNVTAVISNDSLYLTPKSVGTSTVTIAGWDGNNTSTTMSFKATVAGPTSVDDKVNETPTNYGLQQNFPNPFNPSTTIDYTLKDEGNVSLKVYDALGRQVSDLVNGKKLAGTYSVQFNGAGLASGNYYYTLSVNGKETVKKMVLLK